MARKLVWIAVIFAGISLGWMVLGGSVAQRTRVSDLGLREEVSGLWGSSHRQISPELTFVWQETQVSKEIISPETPQETVVTREASVTRQKSVLLESSDVAVDLGLEQRRKGLLWYSMFTVDFGADYGYVHRDPREGDLVITFRFPSNQSSYDEFHFSVDGREDVKILPQAQNGEQIVQKRIRVTQGSRVPFSIAYRSRGLESWHYLFGEDVNRVKNFKLAMNTDFDRIDFPPGTMSPSRKDATAEGWRLVWESGNLISRLHVGMEMPRRLNPGPLAAKISFFAPVCLGFYFVWILVITLFRGIDLHPINYLFLGAAFFAFHLLFSYTVDHLPLIPAFLLASGVSVFLATSYLRLVVGLRFAAVEAGLSQLIYLVLFSYAHFFEGFTGLIVTCGSILTLFALMQLTGRVDWSEVFSARGRAATVGE